MMEWNGDKVATLCARYATAPLDELAVQLKCSLDDVHTMADRIGLYREPGDDDTLTRRGAERLAAVIAARWADEGVRVAPKLTSFRARQHTCWVVRLPPVSAYAPPRRKAVVRSRVRADWPPGSNLALLQRQDAVRRRYFFNGAMRLGVSA